MNNAIYTCPMHPEVRRDHSGDCPKCGMALEPATVASGSDEADNAELHDMTRRFWIAAALTLPVFVLAMAHMVPALGRQAWVKGDLSRWAQFALSTPVVFWAGWPFFRRGGRSLVTRHLNMFTLVSIGVGAAFIFSAVAMLLPGLFPRTMLHEGRVGVYFEAAGMITVLVLLGQVLELRARSRTGSAIKALLNLAPPTARQVAPGGDREVPLERLEKVTTLVVDKTGTLTEGKPKLMDVLPADAFEAKSILRLAASLEQNSEHPLAAAIVQGAKDRSLTLEAVNDFRSVTAGGVVGIVASRAVLVGKPDFLRNEKVAGLEPFEASAQKLQEEGKTAMFVAIDGQPAGILAVADPIKTTTAEAIRELHALGLKLVMLTGDNRLTAAAVAKQLGLDRVEAEIEPAGKVAHVKKLRAEGQHVAMAGDGINDAPALSEADVGIAMGTGTDVAMQSAGITLVKGDLRGIAQAVRLSRATMSNIRQNLVFAFLYNALGIPVAAGALYPFFGLLLSPVIAGAAMSLSSVSVIGNALRLRKVKL
jgi:Cu+-exporting ATPase